MKNIIESYRDIEHMVAVRKKMKEAYELDIDYQIGKKGDFNTKQVKYGLHITAENVDKVLPKLDENNRQLEKLLEIKKEIDDHINSLEGLDQKVVRMKLIEGLTYREIADKLGYSPEYIRAVGAKNILHSDYRQY